MLALVLASVLAVMALCPAAVLIFSTMSRTLGSGEPEGGFMDVRTHLMSAEAAAADITARTKRQDDG